MGLTVGDRVALERRLDITDERVKTEIRISEAFRERIRERVAFLSALAWFALGMAVASLVVQLVRIILVAAGRPPS